ncbi:hypothetical protein BU16DRAFT_557275 [Lophium mytilinum]|uniref:BTB domain-containing protein n=1 Tax=Lophium mytilinum TaxID=390894 RepID=A0A6A6R8M4_9PEZI|nr:hypothetical protein BU16DRAFT_557275 [Lophium mytilinum]
MDVHFPFNESGGLPEDFNKLLTGPTIKVVVGRSGEDDATWGIPRKLLCNHSKFFQKATDPSHGFKEALEGMVLLPEEDPEVFAHFVSFIYTGGYYIDDDAIAISMNNYDAPNAHAAIWMLADKLFSPRLQYQAMKKLYENYIPTNQGSIWYLLPHAVSFVFRNVPESSKLRLFMEDTVVQYWDNRDVVDMNWRDEWIKLCLDNPDFNKKLLLRLSYPAVQDGQYLKPMKHYFVGF